MPERVREKKRAETEADAAYQRGRFVAADAKAQQAREERGRGQLKNQREIVGNDWTEGEAKRQREKRGEGIEGAP